MELPDYSKLFIDGREIESEYGTSILRIHETGELIVSSGKIVASDAFLSHTSPFKTVVPPSRYPVSLSIAHLGSDQRVAAARLKFSNTEPVKWEMALTADQDLASLKEEEIFGYPVDSGTGCFMDVEVAEILMESENFTDPLMAELDKTYVHTWSWANFSLEPVSQANIVVFSSGLGDGIYASYFGLDKKGDVTSLVTDFIVFHDAEVG